MGKDSAFSAASLMAMRNSHVFPVFPGTRSAFA